MLRAIVFWLAMVLVLLPPAVTLGKPLDLRPVDKTKPCTTLENKLFTLTRSDLDLAFSMVSRDDDEALRRMNKEDRVFSSKKGIVVFIRDETNDYYQLRPKGRTVHIWMRKRDIVCQKVPRD